MFIFTSTLNLTLYLLIPIGFIGFAVQCVALRIRDTRAYPQDPQLGRKSLLYFFLNASILMFLGGLTLSVENANELLFESSIRASEAKRNGDIILAPIAGQPNLETPLAARDWFNDRQRTALGIMTSGCLYSILCYLAIYFLTNDSSFPAVGRAFASIRLFIAGIIVFMVTTIGIVLLFRKEIAELKEYLTIFSFSVVWWPVAVLHLVLIFRTKGWYREKVTATTAPQSEQPPLPSPPQTAPDKPQT